MVHWKAIGSSLPTVIMPPRTNFRWAVRLLLSPTKTLENFLFRYCWMHSGGLVATLNSYMYLGPISPLQPIASFNFPVSSKENAHLPATALRPEVGQCKLKVPQGEQLLPVNWPAIVDAILDIGPVGKELSSHLQSVTATWFNTGSLCEDIPPLYIFIIFMQDLMK